MKDHLTDEAKANSTRPIPEIDHFQEFARSACACRVACVVAFEVSPIVAHASEMHRFSQ